MISHYNSLDLTAALESLPIEKGSIVFIHSNIGFFGRMDGVDSLKRLCKSFFNAIMDRIGPRGTIVVPYFTYSFPKKTSFNVSEKADNMGAFSDYVFGLSDTHRSLDPCYSVCANGYQSKELTKKAPQNSFDEKSFFSRFLKNQGVILNLNFDAGSTYLHFLEREFGVPYRYDKTFKGEIKTKEKSYKVKNTIFVRDLNDSSSEPCFEKFTTFCKNQNSYIVSRLGRGEIGMISAKDCYYICRDNLQKDISFLVKG